MPRGALSALEATPIRYATLPPLLLLPPLPPLLPPLLPLPPPLLPLPPLE